MKGISANPHKRAAFADIGNTHTAVPLKVDKYGDARKISSISTLLPDKALPALRTSQSKPILQSAHYPLSSISKNPPALRSCAIAAQGGTAPLSTYHDGMAVHAVNQLPTITDRKMVGSVGHLDEELPRLVRQAVFSHHGNFKISQGADVAIADIHSRRDVFPSKAIGIRTKFESSTSNAAGSAVAFRHDHTTQAHTECLDSKMLRLGENDVGGKVCGSGVPSTGPHALDVLAAAPLEEEADEYWDEEDEYDFVEFEGSITARSIRSRGDNTTSGMTIVLLPKMTARVERELSAAKAFVESTQTPEEMDDEAWDTSMVAEYGDEIFSYLRELEVCRCYTSDYLVVKSLIANNIVRIG